MCFLLTFSIHGRGLFCGAKTEIPLKLTFLFTRTDSKSVRHEQKAIRKMETRGQVKCISTMKDSEAMYTSVSSYVLAIPLRHFYSPTFSTEMRGHSQNKHDYCKRPGRLK